MTITSIPLPDDQEPDLFDLPTRPAPVQYDLFTEEKLQQVATAPAQCPHCSPGESLRGGGGT